MCFRVKAQVSIEFLLLLVVSFSVLVISLYALQQLSDSASFATKRSIFLRESSFFYDLVKELCITGDGNTRIVEFPYEFEVLYDGKVMLKSDYGEMSFESGCEVQEGKVRGKVTLANEDGKIVFYS